MPCVGPGRRTTPAAPPCVRTVRTGGHSLPPVRIPTPRASARAAQKAGRPGVAQRQHHRLPQRADNAQQATRQRARPLRPVTAAGPAQRCLGAPGPIRDHVCARRQRLPAHHDREASRERVVVWNTLMGVAMATECSRMPGDSSSLIPISHGRHTHFCGCGLS